MTAQATEMIGGALAWSGGTAVALDQAGFEALYATHARPLQRYLLGVTGRPDVADDLLQETFCRFLLRGPVEMAEEEARRYLFRVATNLLRDRWRRGEDRPEPEPGEERGATPDLDQQMDVQRAMLSLKPRERDLLWLAYVEGMSHAEIADAMGLSAMSVRLLLFRARGRAATLLRPKGNER